MSIHIALHHQTHYRYDRQVTLGPQVVRLRPAPHCRTRILSYSLRVTPEKHFLNWQQDPQSNFLARIVLPEPTNQFLVEVDLVAEMAVLNPFDFFLEPEAEVFPFKYDKSLEHDLAPFQLKGPPTPFFMKFLGDVKHDLLNGAGLAPEAKSQSRRTMDFLVALNQRLWRDIKYLIRLEPGVQTPEQTLAEVSGSCRDSAWLLCQMLRHLGLAARFVSGYLIQLKPDVKSLDGPSGAERDFTDLHAWCEVYLPGAGWIGFDPTSGLLAGEGHIPLAATSDPQSAAPISGLVGDCKCELSFDMKVERIHESPRVTKPYTEEQWGEIELLGRHLDTDLARQDVRLTMGGEPTFVSIDDRDGAEWNTIALGPKKRGLADDLIKRLKRRFTTGALLHQGQGKLYPGESLPRWSFGCYWRKDGQVIWEDEALFADEAKDYGFAEKQAEAFIHALAKRLGCGDKWIMPAFEDVWYHLWKERRLPVNVDLLKSRLKDEEERARLAKVFEQGLDHIVGFALPLQRSPSGSPPDWVSAGDQPYVTQRDPLDPRPPLPPRQAFVAASWPGVAAAGRSFTNRPTDLAAAAASSALVQEPQRGESAASIVRTALCVEPRHGRLHVFMPPAETLEDYLDCVGAVEDTAAALNTPVVIEGYPPPFDPRINVLKVTPDPGVIEVNMHPTSSWDEMVRQTEGLYDEARLARLGTEKFMLDGRHTGTGGGNHIVLGGPTPADSPLLRRPDLLRSLVAYWQNHPSLSFLFSSLFIGPTSQSPRVDEARNDSLYELGVAFRQVPDHAGCPPWLVDRLFRNLLVDATGNMHRAEFSIDKLYSPDSSSGCLGLLELRAFEMPPHARMSLAQQLLLRTLIAKFWQQPYKQDLVRWGTDIHDRWMLPHFVWSDLGDVIEDLHASGYPMKLDWFKPHLEFRFPQIGDLEVKNICLEVRQALEPWHVLGEEPGPGGTVRYVDSRLERVQVKARGLTDSRHVISVGGVAIPQHSTGINGEYVAGVRYRAWQPPNCLHPTIGLHTPLVFDIVDIWNGRSIGGCTYHVVHPGGRHYETFPVNAYEAESRRLARFFRLGHTPGPMQPRAAPASREFPFTLDLRLC